MVYIQKQECTPFGFNLTYSMKQRIFLSLVLVLVPFCAAAQHAIPVVVYIEDHGKFEVLDSMARSTNTGAVFFGLMGYLVEEQSRAKHDRQKESEAMEHMDSSACTDILLNAFITQLASYDYEVVRSQSTPSEEDQRASLRLKVDQCGFRLVNSTDRKFSAFLSGYYWITPARSTKTTGKQELMVTGNILDDWEHFSGDAELVKSEFLRAQITAGNHLANKLIFGN